MHLGGVQYISALSGAFMASALITPVLRSHALRKAIVDAPDGDRKRQEAPVPYLGGMAIVVSLTIVLLTALWIGGAKAHDVTLLLGILVPAVALALVGLADDLRGLSAKSRFIAQSIAAAISGVALAQAGTRSGLTGAYWLDAVITIVWVVGITNALNLLDNMDGLASGVAAIAGLGYFAIAATNGQYLIAALALALAGACLGFLVWNHHPASIYMGDSGALFIGFLLVVISIRIQLVDAQRLLAMAAPALVLFVPVLDTTVVVLSRLRRRVSPFVGGRDHLSHRLESSGLSVRQSVAVLYAITVASCVSAWFVANASDSIGVALVGIWAVLFAGVAAAVLKSETLEVS